MRIFFSYAHLNRDLVEKLVKGLEGVNHDVWYDRELFGGQYWWDAIMDEICACDVLLFGLTPESLMSPYCQAEYTYALAWRKPILPVLMSSVKFLPDELGRIQYVDIRGLDDRDALIAILGSLIPLRERLKDDTFAPPKQPPERPPMPEDVLRVLIDRVHQTAESERDAQQIPDLIQHIQSFMAQEVNLWRHDRARDLLAELQQNPYITEKDKKDITTILLPAYANARSAPTRPVSLERIIKERLNLLKSGEAKKVEIARDALCEILQFRQLSVELYALILLELRLCVDVGGEIVQAAIYDVLRCMRQVTTLPDSIQDEARALQQMITPDIPTLGTKSTEPHKPNSPHFFEHPTIRHHKDTGWAWRYGSMIAVFLMFAVLCLLLLVGDDLRLKSSDRADHESMDVTADVTAEPLTESPEVTESPGVIESPPLTQEPSPTVTTTRSPSATPSPALTLTRSPDATDTITATVAPPIDNERLTFSPSGEDVLTLQFVTFPETESLSLYGLQFRWRNDNGQQVFSLDEQTDLDEIRYDAPPDICLQFYVTEPDESACTTGHFVSVALTEDEMFWTSESDFRIWQTTQLRQLGSCAGNSEACTLTWKNGLPDPRVFLVVEWSGEEFILLRFEAVKETLDLTALAFQLNFSGGRRLYQLSAFLQLNSREGFDLTAFASGDCIALGSSRSIPAPRDSRCGTIFFDNRGVIAAGSSPFWADPSFSTFEVLLHDPEGRESDVVLETCSTFAGECRVQIEG